MDLVLNEKRNTQDGAHKLDAKEAESVEKEIEGRDFCGSSRRGKIKAAVSTIVFHKSDISCRPLLRK